MCCIQFIVAWSAYCAASFTLYASIHYSTFVSRSPRTIDCIFVFYYWTGHVASRLCVITIARSQFISDQFEFGLHSDADQFEFGLRDNERFVIIESRRLVVIVVVQGVADSGGTRFRIVMRVGETRERIGKPSMTLY